MLPSVTLNLPSPTPLTSDLVQLLKSSVDRCIVDLSLNRTEQISCSLIAAKFVEYGPGALFYEQSFWKPTTLDSKVRPMYYHGYKFYRTVQDYVFGCNVKNYTCCDYLQYNSFRNDLVQTLKAYFKFVFTHVKHQPGYLRTALRSPANPSVLTELVLQTYKCEPEIWYLAFQTACDRVVVLVREFGARLNLVAK